MKKNMIALAVAGALVAPVAMADVTVSGGLQAEVVHIGGDGSQANGLYAADGFQVGKENSGNYGFLKFSASEDLGDGMKAIAVYNLNANVGDTNKGGLDTRDAYIGLSTGLGTVLAGTLATPYKSSTAGWDPMLATSFQARGNNGMSMLQNGYVSNALAYANSFFGGMVKVVAAVVLDEGKGTVADTNNDNNSATSFSVAIAPMSGLDVAIAYVDARRFSDASLLGVGLPAVAVSDKDAIANKLGVKYTMGAFTVAYQVERLDGGLTATGEGGNVHYATGTFKINDANSVSVSAGKTSKKIGAIAATNYDFFPPYKSINLPIATISTSDSDGKYYAVMFNHAFSKNTSAYVGARHSNSGVVTSEQVDVIGGVGTISTKTAASMENAVGVGMRINF